MKFIPINQDRLWQSIEDINRFGANDAGGVCRLEFSPENKAARDLFTDWCQQAGCTVRVDRFGNLFARRRGTDEDAPAVIAGSHLDTQTSGGRFDGVFGVMAALETIRTLNDLELETRLPVEIAVWTNEEGELFRPMIGSEVWCGVLGLEEALAMREADGMSIRDGLDRMGYLGETEVNSYPVQCYFEAHIEQGPILFDRNEVIGVVTSAQKQYWYNMEVIGQEAHAGPTPMESRRDAMVAVSRMVTEFNRIGRQYADARATCGHFEVYPNSRNTIPGRVHFTGDLRHPDPSVLDEMDEDMRRSCAEIADKAQVRLDISLHTVIDSVPFNDTLVGWVREAAKESGQSWRDMYTGAGHDAVNIARHYPTAMVFVPCKDGISHNPAEDARPDHLAAGAGTLATVVHRAATHTGTL